MDRLEKVVYPETFEGKHVREHWEFENDLKSILERSGHKADFWGKYQQRLQFLDNRQKECIIKSDWFEKLKQADGLYSMLFNKSQKNIRILFTFIECNKLKCALLLYAFEEKDNKNMSKYSYSTRIPLAKKRQQEVLKDD